MTGSAVFPSTPTPTPTTTFAAFPPPPPRHPSQRQHVPPTRGMAELHLKLLLAPLSRPSLFPKIAHHPLTGAHVTHPLREETAVVGGEGGPWSEGVVWYEGVAWDKGGAGDDGVVWEEGGAVVWEDTTPLLHLCTPLVARPLGEEAAVGKGRPVELIPHTARTARREEAGAWADHRACPRPSSHRAHLRRKSKRPSGQGLQGLRCCPRATTPPCPHARSAARTRHRGGGDTGEGAGEARAAGRP